MFVVLHFLNTLVSMIYGSSIDLKVLVCLKWSGRPVGTGYRNSVENGHRGACMQLLRIGDACMQLAQLDEFVQKKRRLARHYEDWLIEWPEIQLFSEPTGAKSNYWLNAIIAPNRQTRDDFLRHTNELGVMTRPMWTPMHTLPMYEHCQRLQLDNAESIENRFVNIPSSVVSLE